MLKTLQQYTELHNPQLQPRYSGIPSFFRAPSTQELSLVDIGIIGVPFDGGVTNRTGARHGPRAVRDQSSLLRPINSDSNIAPFELARVYDLGDCWIERPFELQQAHAEITEFYQQIVHAGVMPLSIGGDHSVTLPILRALAKDRPVGLIHIDAHCDTGDDYLGSKFHHGAPFSRAVEEGLIDPKHTIQIGIRGTVNSRNQWDFSLRHGMRIISMREFYEQGWRAAAAEARRISADMPVYLSFDIDSLDPTHAPGTGTPEAGGMNMLEAMFLLRELRGLNFIGGDLVEVAPPFDVGGITAFNGASLLFEILCLMAEARHQRK